MAEYEGSLEIPCPYCGGTGEVPAAGDDTAECRYCGGDGKQNVGNIAVAALSEKLDAIIAEQSAQRVDLTAALTTIIQKLND